MEPKSTQPSTEMSSLLATHDKHEQSVDEIIYRIERLISRLNGATPQSPEKATTKPDQEAILPLLSGYLNRQEDRIKKIFSLLEEIDSLI